MEVGERKGESGESGGVRERVGVRESGGVRERERVGRVGESE